MGRGISTATTSITARWSAASCQHGYGGDSIWTAGTGLAWDGPGQILLVTGNGSGPGTYGTSNVLDGQASPPADLGNAVVRVCVQGDDTLAPTDFFAPSNSRARSAQDWELGSGAVTVLPAAIPTSPATAASNASSPPASKACSIS